MATSVWRGYISFGLVTIPVRLFRAARAERVKLREVYAHTESPEPPEPVLPKIFPDRRTAEPVQETPPPAATHAETPLTVGPVRRVSIDESGETVAPQALSKGYEFERGRFVSLDANELKSLAPKTSTTMELLEFVGLESVDPIFFETSYYVQPEAAGERPYALLFESLKQTHKVGIAQFAMHRREHIVLIRAGKSGLIAHTMYFLSEVRADQEYKTDAALVGPKELPLANALVNGMAAEFDPAKYRDNYREKVEALVAAKVAGEPAGPAGPPPARSVPDITEALKQSLAGLKKPPLTAVGQVSHSRRRKRS